MTTFSDIKRRWMADPAFRREYDALEGEFSIALELIRARASSGLTQGEVAERMGTTQSVIARLESGTAKPSLRTLERYARATGTRPVVKLVRASA
ncbi:MAG: transcriptional regulator [Gammaproteobacteria bacterium HGW-Gammaproteobacteria-7]|nr:MAG: transcriptional regulator [Gammaproteobacteria bacterium HGW-Gammaproteobacteria-7]